MASATQVNGAWGRRPQRVQGGALAFLPAMLTTWQDAELRCPLSGAPLRFDTPHSLATEATRWPVIDDIPFLRADRPDLARAALAALDMGDRETALVALLGDQDGWARSPPPPEADRRRLVREAVMLSFRTAMDLLAFGPVGTYFQHRWSDPTFLSGLALAEAHWHAPSRVFELGCGAGHFLREFGRTDAEAAGGDLVFGKLWLARHFVAPGARLLCFDAAAPWPLQDGAADLVFCHDAFYFLPDKPHVANEMRRVAGAGRVLVGHAHNALVDNLSAGAPLAPAEYAALFGAARLYDDRELTAALVEARAPRAVPADALAEAPAIALAAGEAAREEAREMTGGLAMPPPGTRLRRNPLYDEADGICRLRWPSERYAREYGPLATYPDPVRAAPDAVLGEDSEIDALARRRVYVDLPARW